jgi:F-type H+-transporting ATPase subunit gamma
LNQTPQVIPFLPVGEIKGVGTDIHHDETLVKGTTEFIFEPGVGEVFGSLLPHYLNFRVYQILLEAKASEHSSRMVAMKNATDNAKQIIKDLTLEYNKLRQANITKELLEITSAAMAMS